MSFTEKRKYERRPFVKPIRCYLLDVIYSDGMEELEKTDCEGVSVDISNGGLGMMTDHLLREGDILFFEDEIKPNDFIVHSAIVRWALEIEINKYRVGMEFRR